MSDKRQKNQLVLAFTEEGRGEGPKASQEGTESLTAKCETERPASHEQLMEEVCERENCWQAYKRVKANKGIPGIDAFQVGELSANLKQRPAHQAVAKAQQYIAEGHRWVVELDLEKFFDRVNYPKLMAAIPRRVTDRR